MEVNLFNNFVKKQQGKFNILFNSETNCYDVKCCDGCYLDIETWSDLIKDFVTYIIEEYFATRHRRFRYITMELFNSLGLKQLNIYEDDDFKYIVFYVCGNFESIDGINSIPSAGSDIQEIYYELASYGLYAHLKDEDNLDFSERDLYKMLSSPLRKNVYAIEKSKDLVFKEVTEKSYCSEDRFFDILPVIGNYGDYDLVNGVIHKVPTGCRIDDIDDIVNTSRCVYIEGVETQSYITLSSDGGDDTYIYFDLALRTYDINVYVNIFNRVDGVDLVVQRNKHRLEQLCKNKVEYIVIYANRSTATSWYLGEGITKTYPTLFGSKCFSSQLCEDLRFYL